ncbi:MAG: alanine racemase [Caulobacteraceae bacterium]|nr:alanine racemase [Caulobacteraceae bacterium]
MSQARLTIDLDALARNFRTLAGWAQGAEVAPVLKADAYGLGAAPVARRLTREGARRFYVARLSEGEALRAALGPGPQVLVLDGLTPGDERRMSAASLTPVLLSLAQVDRARAWKGPAVLHVDTGMNRSGLTVGELGDLDLTGLNLRGLLSHLGSAHDPADPRNALQLERLTAAKARLPNLPTSLAASAGAALGPAFRFDQVRPGVSLFGGGPEERPDARLDTVATLTAPVVNVRHVEAGELMGYGSRRRAERPMRLAIVAAGYADGIIRRAGGGGRAWLAGALRPVVLVNMDLSAIEIGAAAVSEGDEAELLGPHVPLDDLAAWAGTVAHEILVRLSPRAERIYLGAA